MDHFGRTDSVSAVVTVPCVHEDRRWIVCFPLELSPQRMSTILRARVKFSNGVRDLCLGAATTSKIVAAATSSHRTPISVYSRGTWILPNEVPNRRELVVDPSAFRAAHRANGGGILLDARSYVELVSFHEPRDATCLTRALSVSRVESFSAH